MIILLGNPGSGKSTQGKMLTDRTKLRWVSMSDILRPNVPEEYKKKMQAGELFSGSVVFDALAKALNQLGDEPELVLDGFPRSIDQAEWLLEKSNQKALKVTAVIYLHVDKEVVQERMLLRGRSDDNIDIINKRFNDFDKTSLPAIEALEKDGIKILKINADQTPEEIYSDIISELNNIGVEV